jgi:hypothetical protein
MSSLPKLAARERTVGLHTSLPMAFHCELALECVPFRKSYITPNLWEVVYLTPKSNSSSLCIILAKFRVLEGLQKIENSINSEVIQQTLQIVS